MLKQRLVSFFDQEKAEECAEENNTKVIPRLACIEGHFYEWYDVWIDYEEEVEDED